MMKILTVATLTGGFILPVGKVDLYLVRHWVEFSLESWRIDGDGPQQMITVSLLTRQGPRQANLRALPSEDLHGIAS